MIKTMGVLGKRAKFCGSGRKGACLALLAAMLLAAPGPAAAEPSRIVVEQALTQYQNGALATPVRVNQGEPLEFIVDTGATLSGIWSSVVLRNALSHRHLGNADIDAADGTLELRILQFQSMSVSKLKLDPPVLMEFPDYYSYFRRPLSGILGADFLQKHVVVFDFPRDRIVFYPKEVDLKRKMPDYFDAVPLRYSRAYSALLFTPRVNGKKVRALLDTGAARTTILETEAKRLGIDYKDGPKVIMTGVGGNPLPAYLVTVDHVSAGARNWPVPEIVVSQFAIDSTSGFSMLFGSDLLGQTPFAVDYGRNRLLLARPEAVKIAEAERARAAGSNALLPGDQQGFPCAFPAAALEGLECITN